MNGTPSENVDDLDSRVKELDKRCDHLEYLCERHQGQLNKIFAETRDLLKAHADSQKPKKKRGDRSEK